MFRISANLIGAGGGGSGRGAAGTLAIGRGAGSDFGKFNAGRGTGGAAGVRIEAAGGKPGRPGAKRTSGACFGGGAAGDGRGKG